MEVKRYTYYFQNQEKCYLTLIIFTNFECIGILDKAIVKKMLDTPYLLMTAAL